MADVTRVERPRPAGELEEDAVGILEVDGADEDAVVEPHTRRRDELTPGTEAAEASGPEEDDVPF